MNLHFVCTGNIFRSRLAESLAKSLLPPGSSVHVTSSGVMADSDAWGPLAWFTRQVLQDHNLLYYASPHWTQTSADLLSLQDYLVFMQPFHLKFCQDYFSFTGSDFEVWDISDISPLMTDDELLDFTRLTLDKLKRPVARTVTRLLSGVPSSK